mmetsp:Transcript_11701/g.17764  ORF Transcript_11701/g.17764 Transcript_11701/m.17764 type:complete len:90 (+) Transcript_11701:690-959(+)
MFSTASQQANGKQLSCDVNALGANPTDGAAAQCFCEPDPKNQPAVCAGQGEDCSCPKDSTVLFGAQQNPKAPGKAATWKHASHLPWTAA